MIAHFIASAEGGSLIAACGEVITSDVILKDGVQVGVFGQKCKACEDAAKIAWVTIK